MIQRWIIVDKLPYVTDEFLDEYKTNFNLQYLSFYINEDYEKISSIFKKEENIRYSSKTFEFIPLENETENPEAASRNIRLIRKSLGHLTVAEAENEKLWVALENTFYLNYHLDQLKNAPEKSIEARTVFTRSKKRSLVLNNLSLLWWIGYYMYDESNRENPYHYADYFVKNSYRGNSVAFLSSNIVSNKELVLGVLAAIMELEKNNGMIVNRYSYTNSNKLLNQVSGVSVIDILNRHDIKEIIKDNLLNMDKIRVEKKVVPVSQ